MSKFPQGFIGRIGDGFRKNHWFRPLKPRFWDKSREFCSTVIGFKPRPPGIFSHGFQSKSARGTQERAQIFLTGHLRRHSPLRNFFLCMPRGRDFPQIGQLGSTQLSWAPNSWFHDTFFTISWVLFYYDFSSIVHFQGYICFVFKSTLECFLHALRLYQISKLGYGMFSDSNVSFFHFYFILSNHFIL